MKTIKLKEKQMNTQKISLKHISAFVVAIAIIAGCDADSPSYPVAPSSGTYDGHLLMVKKSDGPIYPMSPTSLTDDSLLALIYQSPALPSSALKDILIAESPLSDTVLIAAIVFKPGMNSIDITEVLNYNSPLSTSVLQRAIDQTSLFWDSDIRDVLLNNSPLSSIVLESVCYRSPSMTSSTNKDVLIASSPLTCSIIDLVVAGYPSMTPTDLQAVLDAQGGPCVSDSSWTITIPVTAGGATLNLLNSSLVVPPGAVNDTTDVTFTITVARPQGLPNALERIYEFSPDGIVFQVPVILYVSFTDAGQISNTRDDDPSGIKFYYFDETINQWLPQPTIVDEVNQRFFVQLSHFSRYAFAR